MIKTNDRGDFVSRLEATTFLNEGLHERILQDLIDRNRDSTLAEIDESGLVLLKPERLASDSLRDRIDLLGIDTDGTAVIIELKRGKHKLHMLQALSYAAMISSRPPEWFIEQLTPQQSRELLDDNGEIRINHQQRIILIAEQFEPQVIIAARWLNNFGIKLKCFELGVTVDSIEPKSLYIRFTQVYPGAYLDQIFPSEAGNLPSEFIRLANDLEKYVLSKDQQSLPKQSLEQKGYTAIIEKGFRDWPEFIDGVKNKHLLDFIIKWNEDGEKILPESGFRLVYPRRGERWRIQPRSEYGWVMQNGRFVIDGESDEEFWKRTLDSANTLKVLRNGTRLHFNLITERDFRDFYVAINGPLTSIRFDAR